MSVPSSDISPMSFLKSRDTDNLSLSSVTNQEIEEEISKLKSNKSVGPFSVPISILKSIKHLISDALRKIFDSSFSSGTVPDSFKIASVTPIFKFGSQVNVSNYRPISLLSVFNVYLAI